MKRFVEGEDRTQGVLLPEFLDDHVAEDKSGAGRGDEPPRFRVQSEADDRHPRGAAAHPGDEGGLSSSPYENLNRQQTLPRFLAAPA